MQAIKDRVAQPEGTYEVLEGEKGRYRKDKMLMYFSSNTLNYRLRYHLLVLVISDCILYDDL